MSRDGKFLCDLGHEHRTARAAEDCKRRYVNRKLYGPNYRGANAEGRQVMPAPERDARAFPNGRCYCGCGTELADPTAFFVRGHDSLAYSKIIRHYGSLANLIAALGGPESLQESKRDG